MAPNDRRCISCRRVAPKSAFLRIVRIHPTHAVQLDQGMGRSAYLCPTVACLQAAQKRDRLSRMLKTKVSPAIYDALWQRLRSLRAAEGVSQPVGAPTPVPLAQPSTVPETATPLMNEILRGD